MAAPLLTASKPLPTASILLTSGIAARVEGVGAGTGAVDALGVAYSVDLAKLEGFFQALNKQLYDSKCEIQQCVTEYVYKEEIKQRAANQLKVDSMLADINLLKDFVCNDNPTGYRQQSNKQDKVSLLKGEVENLKAVIRRMEVQQCENNNVYQRIKAIERNHVQLETAFNEYKSQDLLQPLRVDLLRAKEDVGALVESVRAQMDEKIANIEAVIQEMDPADRLVLLEDDSSDYAMRIKELEVAVADHATSLTSAAGAVQQLQAAAATAWELNPSLAHVVQASGGNRLASFATVDHDVHSSSIEDDASVRTGISSALQASGHHQRAPSFLLNAPKTPVLLARAPSVRGSESRASLLKSVTRSSASHGLLSAAALDAFKTEIKEQYAPLKDVEALASAAAATAKSQRDLLDDVVSLRGLVMIRALRRLAGAHRHSLLRRRLQHLAEATRAAQASHEDARRRKAHAFGRCVSKLAASLQLRRGFSTWLENSDRVFKHGKLKKWIRNKLQPYYERYEPNLLAYIERWKQFVVSSYTGCLFDSVVGQPAIAAAAAAAAKASRASLDASFAGEEDAPFQAVMPNLTAGGRRKRASSELRNSLIHTTGKDFSVDNLKKIALEDLKMRWSFSEQQQEERGDQAAQLQAQEALLTQLKADTAAQLRDQHEALVARLSALEGELAQTKKIVNRHFATRDDEKQDVQALVDTQIHKLQSSLNNYKSSVTVKLSYMKESLDDAYKAVEEQLGSATRRVEVLESREHETDRLKEQMRGEVEALHKKIEQYLLQYEDIYQYLHLHKEQLAQLSRDLLLLAGQHAELRRAVDELVATNAEQHLYLDEEVRWVKGVVQEQHRAMHTMRDSYNKQLRDIHVVLNKSEDPAVLAKEFEPLVVLVLDNAKRYFVWRAVDQQLRGQGGSTPPPLFNPATGLTTAGAGGAAGLEKQHAAQSYKVLLTLTNLCRRICDWMALYCDQELLVHRGCAGLYPPAQSVRTDYSNAFLGLPAERAITVGLLRERLLDKLCSEVDARMGIYCADPALLLGDLVQYLNEAGINSPLDSVSNLAFFSPHKKDQRRSRSAYLQALRSLLLTMLSACPGMAGPALPMLHLSSAKAAPPPEATAANLAATCLACSRPTSPIRRDVRLLSTTLLTAYQTMHTVSPPRQRDFFASNNHEEEAAGIAGRRRGATAASSGACRPQSAPGQVTARNQLPAGGALVMSASAAVIAPLLDSVQSLPSSPKHVTSVRVSSPRHSARPAPATPTMGPIEEAQSTVVITPPSAGADGAATTLLERDAGEEPLASSGSLLASSSLEMTPAPDIDAASSVLVGNTRNFANSVLSMGSPRTDGARSPHNLGADLEEESDAGQRAVLLRTLDELTIAERPRPTPVFAVRTQIQTGSVAMSALVQHSAPDQQDLAQTLADQLDQDKTFHSKHQDEAYSRRVQQDAMILQSRPLKGRGAV